jgi:rod shape-determining protein MreD
MNKVGHLRSIGRWPRLLRVVAYTFVLLLLQVLWIARMPFPALRGDLLLPAMFGVAVEWSTPFSLLWALAWGYVADVLSGEFWGFHVGSYLVAVCLVNLTAERFEFDNPLYQMAFTGVCAVGQSIALGFYFLLTPSESGSVSSMWMHLAVRSLLMSVFAPLILAPIWSGKRSGR